MFRVQLIFDEVLHDILDDWSPSGHLICVFGDAFLTWNVVKFSATSLHEIYVISCGRE